MMYSEISTGQLASDKLRHLLSQVKTLTREGYDAYDANAHTILRCLDKIMVLAKEEKEWYLYFKTIYYILYMLSRQDDGDGKIIRYAEIFYRDQELYMDRELPNYPGTDLAEINTDCLYHIFPAYKEYYQISDEKMDTFMKLYGEFALKYGREWTYYDSLISLGLLYRDREMVRKGKEGFDRCSCNSCYVCSHIPHFGYYLIYDDLGGAEELLMTLVSKNIPVQYRWCYKKCERANELSLYTTILDYCLLLGKSEIFGKVFEKHGRRLYSECERDWGTTVFLFHLMTGEDYDVEGEVRQAAKDLELAEKQRTSTMGSVYDFLCWYCYFRLLEQKGVQRVKLESETDGLPEADEEGKLSCGELWRYFEKKADELGNRFASSRRRFDYGALKKGYEECVSAVL